MPRDVVRSSLGWLASRGRSVFARRGGAAREPTPPIETRAVRTLRTCLGEVSVDVAQLSTPWVAQIGISLSGDEDAPISLVRIAKRYARFGNNFYQVANAAVIADRLGASEIEIPALMFASRAFPARSGELSIRRLAPPEPGRPTISGSFFAPFGLEALFTALDAAEASRLVERAAAPIFGHHRPAPAREEAGAIALNFRGGDIFDTRTAPHPWYVQPPASFYIAAVEHALSCGFARVVLVCEDRTNPAIDVVEDYVRRRGVAFESERTSARSDLQRLLSAGCIACANSTMSEAAVLLSRTVRQVYSFRNYPLHVDFAPFIQSRIGDLLAARGVHGYAVADAGFGYIPQKQWTGSEAQIEALRTYPRENLRLYRSA